MSIFKGKTVLITGASSGIGRAFAQKFAALGANLIITARSVERLTEVANHARDAFGCKVNVIGIDLSKASAASQLMMEIRKRQLSVDILVNNAGFGKWSEFLSVDATTYQQMLQLNINAVVELTQLVLPEMLAKGSGGIINVASTAAFVPVPYSAVYSATKAFVLSFSEALYGEYHSRGIQITALCPGGTETQFSDVARSIDRAEEKGPVLRPAGTKTAIMDSPEFVAEVGINAFSIGKPYVISGRKNYLTPLMARILPRKTVINAVGNMFKSLAKP